MSRKSTLDSVGVDPVGAGSNGAEIETYSVAEAARRLGVTESAVRKRLDRGVLLAVRTPSGRVRLDAESVEDERRRVLERVAADETTADVERLRDELVDLQARVDQLTADKARLQAAIESLLAADAAMHDTVRQLVAEQRVVD